MAQWVKDKSNKDIHLDLLEYGRKSKPLTGEEAINATKEERIRSVWGLLIKTTFKFLQRLSIRQRANFDPEDILIEMWITLSEKDHKWDPTRGAYNTFAMKLVHVKLQNISDQSNTIQSARNSVTRIKHYNALKASGNLTTRSMETFEAIRRINFRPFVSIFTQPTALEGHTEEISLRSEGQINSSGTRDTTSVDTCTIPDRKALPPEQIVENAETMTFAQPVFDEIFLKFPGLKLTNPKNRPKIREILVKNGIQPH